MLPEWIVIAALAALGAVALLWIYLSILREDVWSISIYIGADPFSLTPNPELAKHPVLTAADVNDVRADFVADPFLVRKDMRWHMFFEVLESRPKRGVIALATSEDALSWRYEGVVLREPFHLSYPYVFEWQAAHYMVPETGEASSVRLYRAIDFPRRWEFVTELLSGKYWDSSFIRRDGLWWLFAFDQTASLTLHYAEQLGGPWICHPHSPLVRNSLRIARPGGRLIEHQGRVVRFAQDGVPTYGSRLRAFQIDEMTTTSYREHELQPAPVLTGSGSHWNKTGMHHVDPHELAPDSWLASVDGNRQRLMFNWRAGARRIADSLSNALPRPPR